MKKTKKHIYCQYQFDYEIPFFDVDSAHITWHGHYIKYFEMARCALLEEIGYTYDHIRADGYGWPIVQLNVKYVRPTFFRQKIRVTLSVVEYDTCLRIDYVISDLATGEKLTVASTTQVVVNAKTGEMQLQAPDNFCQAFEQYHGYQAFINEAHES